MRFGVLFLCCFLSCQDGGKQALPPAGLVVHLFLDSALDLSNVGGFTLEIARKGGFGAFSSVQVEGLTLSSEDRNSDGKNEALLTWPKGFAYTASFSLRLQFEAPESFAVDLHAFAFDASNKLLADGLAQGSYVPDRATEIEVDVTCVKDACSPVAADMGTDAADAGTDGQVIGDGGGGPLVEWGQVAPAAGRSVSGSLVLDQHVGRAFGATTSTSGTLKLESTAVIDRGGSGR